MPELCGVLIKRLSGVDSVPLVGLWRTKMTEKCRRCWSLQEWQIPKIARCDLWLSLLVRTRTADTGDQCGTNLLADQSLIFVVGEKLDKTVHYGTVPLVARSD